MNIRIAGYVATLGIAASAFAQGGESSAGAFLDDSENALGAVAGATGARRDAEKYVVEKGWNRSGIDERGRFVVVALAEIAGTPTNPNFQQARQAAFLKAMLDAKKQVAMHYAQRIATETLYGAEQNARNPENFAKKIGLAASPGIFEKIRLLIHARLDEALRKRGVDPAKATRNQIEAVESVVLTTELRRTIESVAAAEVGALIAQKIFEDGNAMAVVAYYSPASKQLMDAVLGKGAAPTGSPSPKTLTQWAASLTIADLYASHGVQVRFDERGNATLIAFGQAPAAIQSVGGIKMAETAAETTALGALRDYVGEFVEAEVRQDIFERTRQFGDMDKAVAEVEQDVRVKESVKARASALTVSGISRLRTWGTTDKRSGRAIAGAVVAWNIPSAQRANSDRAAFAESAGSKGGEGATAVAATIERPKPGSSKETFDPTKRVQNKVQSKEPDPFD